MALSRGDAGFLLGLAGFLLGGIGAYMGTRTLGQQKLLEEYHEALRLDGESIESLVNRVTALERAASGEPGKAAISPEEIVKLRSDLTESNKRLSAMQLELKGRDDEVQGLRARIVEMEKKLPR